MSFTPNIIRGIEGDDIPLHLTLLGYDVNDIPNRYYFFPLNDHYNTHSADWFLENYKTARQHEVVVFYDLVNIGDSEYRNFYNVVKDFDHPKKVWLTVNQSKDILPIENTTIVQWDFMWNRIKSYYTESIPHDLALHHFDRGTYNLFDLDFTEKRSKKFLSLLGREYGARKDLYEIVKNHDEGYISNRSRGIFLEGSPVIGAFSPVPNHFYQDSYFSIYVESNYYQHSLIHLTEKTFEPLLKGHFILPITNVGCINRLEDMGFQFPDSIDHTYDVITDHAQRMEYVIKEFEKLLMVDLPDMYYHHRDLLQHNRDCINEIPYDRRILDVFDV
jgi:hypothetical protein